MTLLASLVDTSGRVRDTSSRLGKVRELAGLLRTLPGDEVAIAVQYLSGETPQGRSGIGYRALRAAPTLGQPCAPQQAGLAARRWPTAPVLNSAASSR